jgi:hypothetical protein
MVRNARLLPSLVAIVVLASCCYVAWRSGYIEFAALGGILVAPAYLFARSYLELLELITDMLLPK